MHRRQVVVAALLAAVELAGCGPAQQPSCTIVEADSGETRLVCPDGTSTVIKPGRTCDVQVDGGVEVLVCSDGTTRVLGDAGSSDAGDGGNTRDDAGVDAGIEPDPDAGADAGATDAGSVDAGAVDAGSVDAGGVDAGSVDAGSVDAGTPASCGANAPANAVPAASCSEVMPVLSANGSWTVNLAGRAPLAKRPTCAMSSATVRPGALYSVCVAKPTHLKLVLTAAEPAITTGWSMQLSRSCADPQQGARCVSSFAAPPRSPLTLDVPVVPAGTYTLAIEGYAAESATLQATFSAPDAAPVLTPDCALAEELQVADGVPALTVPGSWTYPSSALGGPADAAGLEQCYPMYLRADVLSFRTTVPSIAVLSIRGGTSGNLAARYSVPCGVSSVCPSRVANLLLARALEAGTHSFVVSGAPTGWTPTLELAAPEPMATNTTASAASAITIPADIGGLAWGPNDGALSRVRWYKVTLATAANVTWKAKGTTPVGQISFDVFSDPANEATRLAGGVAESLGGTNPTNYDATAQTPGLPARDYWLHLSVRDGTRWSFSVKPY
jgi:hypothetical protein